VAIVEGSENNRKLTTAEDLMIADRMVRQNAAPVGTIRVGSGYDVHRLGAGDSVMLCGVRIPHTRALQGHSDADVGLHALTDALLGTIAEGDIGAHFPPSDARWRGASSDLFLKDAGNRIAALRGKIVHVDITLVCETPKIGPHRDAMRGSVADILGLGMTQVSVKATTNEQLGFIGREEGIAAMATATVLLP
jgi:2-C-methyl-D-erythritol 4-phosphate cytidylyltransferase/2-C-methyl-D-erythritol 2,4-cyclodiphosphate synthase